MKQTRLALILAATTLAATPALSASVTMLQFGSFETKAEAEKRLSEVTAKHSAELGKMATNIREVKLPPDNLVVYRTQAGPVADRAAAQSICSKLASTGDECYIVQTAMVAAPEKTTETAAASTSAAPDLTSKLSSLKDDAAARDPLNRAALSSVSTEAGDSKAAAKTEDTMNGALDKAAAEQPAVAQAAAESAAASAPAAAKRSFWSRLNPFSDSTPKPEAKLADAAPAPTAAPVETVTSQPLETLPPQDLPAAAPAAAPIVVAAAEPAVTEPMRLPPPPAPLRAADREALVAEKAPLTAPEPVASPISVAPVAPAAPVAANGTVQVEEAKRVPVTSDVTPPAKQAVPVVTPVQPPVSLSPSATDGTKTIWAQIGPFADNDAALAYWMNYRQSHPDFPVVRVRVTTPYQQALRGSSQSWLRVGPVAQPAFVKNLCASLNRPPESTLRCGTVGDLGTTAPLAKKQGLLPSSRYAR